MPISEKQLIANRLNAQKSTGPGTEEGKKRSSINGYRHGITGMGTLMTDEDRKSRDEFTKPIIRDLDPVGSCEFHLAETIAHDTWRLTRIRAIEDNTFAWGHFGKPGNIECEHSEVHNSLTMARTFIEQQKTFNNLSIYEQRITRNIHKNMQLFLQLKDRRKAADREEALLKAKAAKPLTRAASASSPENGFAFSTAQFAPVNQTQPVVETPKSPPITDQKAA